MLSFAPFVLALVGVVLLLKSAGRSASAWWSRAAGFSDLCWLVAVLVCKSAILYEGVRAQSDSRVVWFDLGLAALVTLSLLALPIRVRAWVSLTLGICFSLWIWGDLIHSRFFDDVASFAALRAAGHAAQLMESIASLTTGSDVLLFADLPIAVALAVLLSRRERRVSRRPADLVVAVTLASALALPGIFQLRALLIVPPTAVERQVILNLNLVEEYGLLGFQLEDGRRHLASSLRPVLITDDELEEAREWFVGTAPARQAIPAWAGIAAGKNLILVQVESMQSFVLQRRHRGIEITPNLNRLAERALVFTQANDQTGLGRTSDATLMVMTSLQPRDDSAAAFAFGSNSFSALPAILRDNGYSTLSAVPFNPSFWNRSVTFPAFGFSKSLFAADFEPGPNVGWGLNDRDFLLQSIDQLDGLPEPFLAFLLTLSLHHPYDDFPADLSAQASRFIDGSSFGNYLAAMNFLDSAVGEFFSGLETRGLLADSVVVLYGDHDAGLREFDEARAFLGVGKHHPAQWAALDGVPLLIWTPGDGSPRGERDDPVGLIDLPVTLLPLLGFDATRLAWMGRNLLGDPVPALVLRPGGDFQTDGVYFDAHGPTLESGACYGLARRPRPIDTKACEPFWERSREQRWVSSRVLEFDLQEEISAFLKTALP